MPKEPSFENALAFAGELIGIPGLPGEEREVALGSRRKWRHSA